MMERMEVLPEWALPIRSTFFLAMVLFVVVGDVALDCDVAQTKMKMGFLIFCLSSEKTLP